MTTRRRVLGLLGAGGVGVVAGAGGATAVLPEETARPAGDVVVPRTVSPYGRHQPGVVAPTPRALRVLALDLLPGVDRESLGRLMRLWTGDIEAATLGRAAPGDTAADLAQGNVDLTLTVGWGPGVFALPGLEGASPDGLQPVPAMRHDRLRPHWSGGDVLLLAQAADDTTLAHVLRRLLLDAAPFAALRWEQVGSWRGLDADHRPTTGCNLFGQVDGTANPHPDEPGSARTVWADRPTWFAGGTTLVMRRIAMDLDEWDRLTRDEQEQAVGRDLAHGAPLTGGEEHSRPALGAHDEYGRPTIARDAHVRRAHPSANFGARIFRKGVNYTTTESGRRESGLVFLSFQADVATQFTPIQQRLDELDALNTWTTAVGSAEFAVLPGFERGGWLGESLLG